MDLNIYQVILGSVVSEKAYKLNKQERKLVLRVHPQANKPLIAQALEKLFNVTVEKINIVVRKGKNRIVQRRAVVGALSKIAYITLAEGQSLDLMSQSDVQVAPVQEQA